MQLWISSYCFLFYALFGILKVKDETGTNLPNWFYINQAETLTEKTRP
jgi:hypothetical protein